MQSPARPTENSEAHELYLRGRFYWNKGLGPEFDKSRQYYQQAVELDPNYALAYVGLAISTASRSPWAYYRQREEWSKMEESMANKALELDPTLGKLTTRWRQPSSITTGLACRGTRFPARS